MIDEGEDMPKKDEKKQSKRVSKKPLKIGSPACYYLGNRRIDCIIESIVDDMATVIQNKRKVMIPSHLLTNEKT